MAIATLSLAAACRASFDPAGEVFAFGKSVSKPAAWPRLEALLASGPLRGRIFTGVYWGAQDSFPQGFASCVASRFDQGKLPAPFGDDAWAKETLKAASKIAWTGADGARLAVLFDQCRAAHDAAILETPEIHDPSLPCGDAMAWMLAKVPAAAKAYFGARSAPDARLPPLSEMGEAMLALAGVKHGWTPELFASRRSRDESNPRLLGELFAGPHRDIGARLIHLGAQDVEQLRHGFKLATDMASRSPALAHDIFRHAFPDMETLAGLSAASTLSGGSLWLLTALAAPSLDAATTAMALRVICSQSDAARAYGNDDTLRHWRQGLDALAKRAASLDARAKKSALRAFSAGLQLALGPDSFSYRKGASRRDELFSHGLADLGQAAAMLGGSSSMLLPIAKLGPLCSAQFVHAEAADIAASAAEPTLASKRFRL